MARHRPTRARVRRHVTQKIKSPRGHCVRAINVRYCFGVQSIQSITGRGMKSSPGFRITVILPAQLALLGRGLTWRGLAIPSSAGSDHFSFLPPRRYDWTPTTYSAMAIYIEKFPPFHFEGQERRAWSFPFPPGWLDCKTNVLHLDLCISRCAHSSTWCCQVAAQVFFSSLFFFFQGHR